MSKGLTRGYITSSLYIKETRTEVRPPLSPKHFARRAGPINLGRGTRGCIHPPSQHTKPLLRITLLMTIEPIIKAADDDDDELVILT